MPQLNAIFARSAPLPWGALTFTRRIESSLHAGRCRLQGAYPTLHQPRLGTFASFVAQSGDETCFGFETRSRVERPDRGAGVDDLKIEPLQPPIDAPQRKAGTRGLCFREPNRLQLGEKRRAEAYLRKSLEDR